MELPDTKLPAWIKWT